MFAIGVNSTGILAICPGVIVIGNETGIVKTELLIEADVKIRFEVP